MVGDQYIDCINVIKVISYPPELSNKRVLCSVSNINIVSSLLVDTQDQETMGS